jgi:excisionase family DNA binding protein
LAYKLLQNLQKTKIFDQKAHFLMEREILNSDQASKLLGIPEHTVLRLARKGIIPGRKAGRNWLFSKTNLINWVRKEHK